VGSLESVETPHFRGEDDRDGFSELSSDVSGDSFSCGIIQFLQY
jgi:hypothetical protein